MPALTQRGQVTVPLDIRRLLGLSTGDEVRFVVLNGRVEVQKAAQGHRSAYGLLRVSQSMTAAPQDDESELLDALIVDDDRIRGRACIGSKSRAMIKAAATAPVGS